MARPRTQPQPEVPGLAARRIAADVLDGVLRRRTALDEQLSGKGVHPGIATLADRDRALMRRLTATVLRRLGTLRDVVGKFLDRGFPADAPRTETILLLGAAQILWLEVPDHAAVDLSVRLAQADRRASRYAGLVNAVLRKVAQDKTAAEFSAAARHAGLAFQAVDGGLRQGQCAGHRHRERAGARARYHRQDKRRRMGRPAARPRASDRLGSHTGARRGVAAARLSRRRLVGAGHCRLDAGAAVWRPHRPTSCGSVRCAGGQDRAACASRRAGHRNRPRPGAARAFA